MRILRFMILWVVLTFFFSLFNSSFVWHDILIQAINSFLFSFGFYFSYDRLIRPLLYKGKVVKFVILYFLTTLTLSMVSMVLIYQIYIYRGKTAFVHGYWHEPVFYSSSFVLMFLVISTLLSVRFFKDRMQTQLKLENLEKEKISAELSFLKAQINPHFLFNSLNNILFQIDKSNQDARETLLKFSEMLRYQLYECSTDKIEIEKELQYIRNYIEIQMLRKTEKYNCELKVSPSVRDFQIAPLLLIPFIENAFKYVSNHSNGKNSIRIAMDYENNEFRFSITNDKDKIHTEAIKENAGIGLVNVRRRLDLLYPNNHNLGIVNSENEFTVAIRLNVD